MKVGMTRTSRVMKILTMMRILRVMKGVNMWIASRVTRNDKHCIVIPIIMISICGGGRGG